MGDSLRVTSGQRDWSLDALRVVAILGVVSIHTFGALVTNPAAQGTPDRWVALILNSGMIWAVPVFVMMSGALVLEPRAHADGVAGFYRRRLSRLLPAFVFWQVFYVVVVRELLTGLDESAGDVLKLVLAGNTYTHLYFLWLIVGLYALAPVLHAFLVAGGERRALWFAGVVLAVSVLTSISSSLFAYAGDPRPLTLLALTQWIPYVGYFLAGWALKDIRIGLVGRVVVTGVAVLAIAEIILQAGLHPGGPAAALVPLSYYGPVPAVAALALFVAVRAWWGSRRLDGGAARVMRVLSDSAFGVYLVHFVILILLRRVPLFAGFENSATLSALLFSATVLVSFAVVGVLRRVPLVRRIV